MSGEKGEEGQDRSAQIVASKSLFLYYHATTTSSSSKI